MKKIPILIAFILYSILLPTIFNFDTAEAYKTGSYNFCSVFPSFPECTGWRIDAISDSYNYWFCDYVDLEKLCESKPDPEKQITVRSQNSCCRFIGNELDIPDTKIEEKYSSNQVSQLGAYSSNSSISPLIIWTDKDHYNFRDKVTVYGKFDFTNFTIKKSVSENEFEQTGEIVNGTSIQTGRIITETPILDVDIKLNEKIVLRNVPVHENGWFVTFFHLNDRYHFSNQNNILSVDYILYDPVPLGGPKTYAIYDFTTGDIAKKENGFDIWIDDSQLVNGVQYGVNVENPERFINLTHHNFVSTRLITPEGYTIPIESVFSIQDLSREYNGFLEYGHGTYGIQITYGDNTSKKTFVYHNSD